MERNGGSVGCLMTVTGYGSGRRTQTPCVEVLIVGGPTLAMTVSASVTLR